MASVVSFGAVNVGGHQKFQPAKLANELAGVGDWNTLEAVCEILADSTGTKP